MSEHTGAQWADRPLPTCPAGLTRTRCVTAAAKARATVHPAAPRWRHSEYRAAIAQEGITLERFNLREGIRVLADDARAVGIRDHAIE